MIGHAATNGRATAHRATAVRCAIYTRKSTDHGLEQDFNSLDNQRERAEDFIRSQRDLGWIALEDRYDDGGVSGALASRPALDRLMADVESGRVDRVVVYKLDRLFRHVFRLGSVLERMEKHGVSLVSVTEPFDTATPAGRFMLTMLAGSAQMERELTAERTRDKVHAARRRGKWTGGPPPLGYDVHPDGGKILVNQAEAGRVRAIFDLYVEIGTITGTVAALNQRGWTTKAWTTKKGIERAGKPWTKAKLGSLLCNPIYLGKMRLKDEIHDGEHEAILSDEVFAAAQARLEANAPTGTATRSRRPGRALLAGILHCAPCGAGMTLTHTTKRGRRYRYYACRTTRTTGWGDCPTKTVPAGDIERVVVEQIRAIGKNDDLVAQVLAAAREQAPDVDEGHLRRALDLFDPVWDHLHAEEKARLLRLLIERVDFDKEAGNATVTFKPEGIQALGEEAQA